MRVTIDNKLYIEDPSIELLDWCKKNLIIDNPDYYKKEKLGKWTGNTPKTIWLYEKHGNDLLLPFGCINKIAPMLRSALFKNKIKPIEPIKYRSNIKLRKYQKDAVERVLKGKNGILVMPPGSGKTQTGLEIATRISGKTLWLTHTKDLLNQSMNRAKGVLDIDGTYGTITDGKINIGTHITFATIQTLSKMDLSQLKDMWSAIVVDECFPSGTKISTPTGYKELQDLHNDDIVLSFNRNLNRIEEKKVKSVFKLKAHDIVRIKLENGEEVVATKNHPFYVKDQGWINAEDLGGNDYVMQLVRKRDRLEQFVKNKLFQKQKTWLGILLQRMCAKGRSCERCLDGRTQENCIQNNETHKRKISRLLCIFSKKAQMVSGATTRNLKAIKSDRTSSKNKVWKWHGFNCSATKVDACFGRKIFGLCGISYSNKNEKRKWLSNLLQNRYCNSRTDDCGRSGWEFSFGSFKKRARQKERQFFEWVRVESVKVQEQTSDGTFGGLCADGYVYNIEVEDNNNYFANNILVHNCHHAAGSPTRVTQFYKVLSNLSARYKIGLTATPKRADGLEQSMFALLGDIIHEVTRDEISEFLCPVKVETVHTNYTPDYDIVLLGDGTLDYTKLVDAMIHDEDRFELVKNKIEECMSKGSVLVLANRIEYLQRMSDALNGNTLCLSGMGYSKKSKEERKSALEKLNNGELDCVLASYQLAKEGIDVPNLRYVVFATPEKDPTTIQQSVGRVGRAADGKEYGTVVDFVDRFGIYKGWRAKRESTYKKIHAEY